MSSCNKKSLLINIYKNVEAIISHCFMYEHIQFPNIHDME